MGSTSCTDCGLGTSQSASGQTDCVECAIGLYAENVGSSSCDPCLAGTFAVDRGSTSCTSCPAGRYQDTFGAYQCIDCEVGKYTNLSGQSTCLRCSSEKGPEYTSPVGSRECSECIAENYWADGICEPCPVGVDCREPGSTLEQLLVSPGWYRFQPTSTDVYECPKYLDCVGGNGTGDALCSQYAEGYLCSTCVTGYYVRDAVASCSPCGNVDDLWWIPPGILVCVVGCIAFIIYWQRTCIYGWIQRNEEWLENNRRDISARLTALFVNMQIIVLIQSNHLELGGEETPQPYAGFVNALSMFSMDLVQMMPADCLAEQTWSHYDSLLLETFTPILILVVIFLVDIVRCCTSQPQQVNRPRARRGAAKRTSVMHSDAEAAASVRLKHLGYFMAFMILVLPSISRRVCQTFQCTSYDDSEYELLVANLAISCHTRKHMYFQYYAAIMLILYPIGT